MSKKNKKYFMTFGSSHLKNYKVSPLDVMLVIEGDTFMEARDNLMQDDDLDIRNIFAFQYDISQAMDMTEKYRMKLYTKEELLKLKN